MKPQGQTTHLFFNDAHLLPFEHFSRSKHLPFLLCQSVPLCFVSSVPKNACLRGFHLMLIVFSKSLEASYITSEVHAPLELIWKHRKRLRVSTRVPTTTTINIPTTTTTNERRSSTSNGSILSYITNDCQHNTKVRVTVSGSALSFPAAHAPFAWQGRSWLCRLGPFVPTAG